jgi:Tfp pilus assembly PilM family ATPase
MAAGTGIDVGSQTTRVVKLTRRGDAISWAGAVSAKTGEDLRGELKSARINTQGGVSGISGKSTILRYSRVPVVPAWKLKMLVGYEITQGGDADVSFDFRLLNLPTRLGSAHELTVLTAAAKSDALTGQLDQLAQRGIKGVDFVPDAVALAEAFSKCPESREALDEYCLVLDVGASKTEMAIVYNGGLIFARSLGFGGNDFSGKIADALGVKREQAERLKEKRGELLSEEEVSGRPSADQPMLAALAQAGDEFFGLVNASLMFAKAQTKLVQMEIGRVYVSGAGARLKGLAEFVGARLDVRGRFCRPPDEWGVPEEPGRPCQWMIALGLALLSLESPDERMSILPPVERKRQRFWRREVFAYAACVLFVIAAAAGTVAHIHNWTLAKDAITTRRTLAADAAKRDQALDVLIQSNDLRRARLELLAAAAESGGKLAEFVELVKRSQQGAVILSELTYQPGDINKADATPTVILVGTVGASEKTHHDVLDDFSRQLTTGGEKTIEHAGKSSDGGSLDFRLRIPLTNTAGEGSSK